MSALCVANIVGFQLLDFINEILTFNNVIIESFEISRKLLQNSIRFDRQFSCKALVNVNSISHIFQALFTTCICLGCNIISNLPKRFGHIDIDTRLHRLIRHIFLNRRCTSISEKRIAIWTFTILKNNHIINLITGSGGAAGIAVYLFKEFR